MSNLTSVFGGTTTTLDTVVILPMRGGSEAGGIWSDGDYSLPAGMKWTDFESLEFYVGNDTRTIDAYFSLMLPKELIASDPSGWRGVGGYNDANTNYYSNFRATSTSTFNVANVRWEPGNVKDVGCVLVVGRKKRHASMNISNIVNVSGSASATAGNMKFNERLEIDITTELGADYVGKDLIVQAEVYNNTGTGVAGWSKVPYIYIRGGGTSLNYETYGVEASVLGDKIAIKSGMHGLAGTHEWGGTPFGNTVGIGDAPVRVKVWKIEQYIHNSASAAGASYVIENGQNANGYYRRWSDGLIEQWGVRHVSNGDTPTGGGGAPVYDFPIPFTDNTTVTFTGNEGNCTSTYIPRVSLDNNTQWRMKLYGFASGAIAPNSHKDYVRWSAKGY